MEGGSARPLDETDLVFKGRRKVINIPKAIEATDEHVTLDEAHATSLANVLTRHNHLPYRFFLYGQRANMSGHVRPCLPTN